MTSILNKRKIKNLLGFDKRKSNRGMIGASIVGLSLAGATLFGVVKKRNNNPIRPINSIDTLMKDMNFGKNGQIPNLAILNEFSKELLPAKEDQKD